MAADTVVPIMIFFGAPAGIRQTLSAALEAFPDLCILNDNPTAAGRIHRFEDYACPDTARLRAAYRHHSTNDERFELFCFLRWFYMRNFARAAGCSHILHFDADVYVCGRGEDIIASYGGKDFCIQDGSGHTAFTSMAALESLCRFLLDFVETGYKRHLPMVEALRASGKAGGICDMTALQDFYASYDGSRSPANPLICGNISRVPGCRRDADTRIAEIYMRGGRVFLFNEKDNQYAPLATVHFQGERGKALIPFFHQFYGENRNDTEKMYRKFSR